MMMKRGKQPAEHCVKCGRGTLRKIALIEGRVWHVCQACGIQTSRPVMPVLTTRGRTVWH
jgi:ribosomal protein L37AE/L43A